MNRDCEFCLTIFVMWSVFEGLSDNICDSFQHSDGFNVVIVMLS